ncbi:hypothetical protein BKA70DRAFT_1132965 [Coprinopsis sp. MPI-PUGE-AT-0042]|nr:hypothetical protein BKA70DRAFT_1132965 [Coprinopsis sp. MPI-PUGE-AT-0042]
MWNSTPNPNITMKYEGLITCNVVFLILSAFVFAMVGGFSTAYQTTRLVGIAASVLSIFLGITLLAYAIGDNGAGPWRSRLQQNLYLGVYPPYQWLLSICVMVLVAILWIASTAITVHYHVILATGRDPHDFGFLVVQSGPFPSYVELAFSVICAVLSLILTVLMALQRSLTSKEMRKAIGNNVSRYPRLGE